MLTLFATAKPFRGHNGIVQRNALKSWTLLHPDVEVILFGDDDGAAEVAAELGINHVPQVSRHESGMKHLRSFFEPAQQLARHSILCYINCDIVLTSDFSAAIERLRAMHSKFVMIGRRWDIDVQTPLPFKNPSWQADLRRLALSRGNQRSGGWIDYFVFPRGLYASELPDFVIGRVYWDQWLVWKARKSGLPVVDVSEVVTAIHQNHDYGYHPAGAAGVWNDGLAERNLLLAGSKFHLCTIDDATHTLAIEDERRSARHFFRPLYRLLRTSRDVVWLALLDWTRPVRKIIGLRRSALRVPFLRRRRG